MFLSELLPHGRLFIFLTLVVLVVGGLAIHVSPQSAHASEGVFILSQNVYCDRVDVTYNVAVAFPTDTTTIRVFSGGTQIASIGGIATTDGNHSVSIPLNPAQPIGTVLHAEVEVNDGIGFVVTDTGSPMPCYENGGSGGGTNGGEEEPPPPPSNWGGYTDGRLNPDMAEYYTVYCRDDFAHVYRANPQPTVKIAELPISDMLSLNPSGGSFTHDDIHVQRHDDQMTLSGHNGNGAPESGTKTFSLEECVARNGGEPDGGNTGEPNPEPPAENPSPPSSPSSIPTFENILNWILGLIEGLCGVNLLGFGIGFVAVPMAWQRLRKHS